QKSQSFLDTQFTTDIAVNLPSNLLVKMDIASMSASIEGRSPLLDHHLAEFLATLPASFFCRNSRGKALLRDAYRVQLPERVTTAPKRGFEVPLQSWLDNELRDLLHDTLRAPDCHVACFVQRDYLRRVLDGSILKERNRPFMLYSLLMLE